MTIYDTDVTVRAALRITERAITLLRTGSDEDRQFLEDIDAYEMRDYYRAEVARRERAQAERRAARTAAGE